MTAMLSEDYDPLDDDDPEDHWDDDPCADCGPRCAHWGGDNLCMLAIEEQAREGEEYDEKYVLEDVACPVCKERLTMYEIPASELWVWPGAFYNPIIGLTVYTVYSAEKTVLHAAKNIHHIRVGPESSHTDKLIRLLGEAKEKMAIETRECTAGELEELPF